MKTVYIAYNPTLNIRKIICLRSQTVTNIQSNI